VRDGHNPIFYIIVASCGYMFSVSEVHEQEEAGPVDAHFQEELHLYNVVF